MFEGSLEGASPVLYDLTIKPSPCCGDKDHPYPPGDANKDCKVDFTDLAIFCQSWLESGCVD